MSQITVSIVAPAHSGNKSFYGKAKQIEFNGYKYLKSYNTIVCCITPDGEFIRLWGEYSATTMKHIGDFRLNNGLSNMGKKSWEALEVPRDFTIPQEVKNVEMNFKTSYSQGYNSLW